MGFGVLGFGFRVQDSGFKVLCTGFRVLGFGLWVLGFGFRVLGDVISPIKIHSLSPEKPPGRVSPASLPFDTNLRQQGLYPHGGLQMYFKTTHITPR